MASAYEALQLPAAVTRKLLARPERWLTPFNSAQLVLEHGQPVAGAMLLASHGIAGIYWVGTLPEARGRGHAETVTRAISEHAFDLGARAVILQASVMGEPVYRRIGYREFTQYTRYLVPAAH
jgi:predicted GNAT family acetyltransferase